METGISSETVSPATTAASSASATEAVRPHAITATEWAFNIGMFAVSTGVTIIFAYYLFTDPARLTHAWQFVRGLPLAVQVVLWLLLLPWMIALWVWVLPWALPVRLVLVVAILLFAEYLLWPWK